MIPYATSTGTKRNLKALNEAGWRIMVTPDRPILPPDFSYALDNGEWGMREMPLPHDFSRFAALADKYGHGADFVVLPDIIGGGSDSLELSISWLPKLRNCHIGLFLVPIQDGMTAREVGMVLRQNPKVGLFLGGSTEYKLNEMHAWGMVAAAWKRWYHVGRVNTARRIRMCAESGADSFDGTSASRYACTLPLLQSAIDRNMVQPSLFRPQKAAWQDDGKVPW